jgi:hypothetical protein
MKYLLILILLASCNVHKKGCPGVGVSYEDRQSGHLTIRRWTTYDWCRGEVKYLDEKVYVDGEPIPPKKLRVD